MRALTVLAFTLLCTPAAFAQGVSMARTGACYAPDDPYHAGIVPLRSFATMADCVGAGGWDRRAPSEVDMPMGLAAHGWVPVPATPSAAATRAAADAEASRWFKATGGCRESRDDLLARMSRTQVTWSPDGCRVATGVWVDAAMGTALTDPERVEIAHAVPPTWAEERGAAGWTPERRAAFYTDPQNLIALSAEGLAVGGAGGAVAWRPHSRVQACALANTFAVVAHRHGVAYTESDAMAMQAAIDVACTPPTRESLTAERDARAEMAQAQRAAIDAAKGITRGTAPNTSTTPVGAAPMATMTDPKAAPAPATILAQAFARQADDSDAGVVMAEKPPIAEPGGRVRTVAPTPPAPPAPSDGMGTALPDTAAPPPEPSTTYDLSDFNGLRIEEIVNMVNGNTIVRGINDDGQPLNPTVLLQSLGFPPEVINATLQEAFEADDPERANIAPTTPAQPVEGAAGESGNTVRSPLGGPEVQIDPNLPPFDADPMMLGIGAEGVGMSTAP